MTTYYSDEVVQSVAEANDIVDVISGYMTLKRVGSSFKGKCPFHNEKTASFTVSREKQLYHCFGCGAGGNVITFVMEMEKLPFVDALKFLAARVNIVLPEKQNEQQDRQAYEIKKRLYELHRDAANFYYKFRRSNQQAQHYLVERGLSQETIKTFGLGYAPEGWGRLRDFLSQSGYTTKEMLDSGLVLVSETNRFYDRFRHRIMFPIVNPRGQIVGFGGRKLDSAGSGPKYLNSPETEIFSKSYELYNLNHCKNYLENGRILIVEGYMDVISLYEKGIRNTVAALGTAFTPFHGKILERYANEVVIAFDGDQAGISATEKAVNILKKTSLNVKILNLPVNEDPDSCVRKYGLEGFSQLVSKALTVIEYQLESLKKKNDLTQTDGRLQFGNEAIKILRQLDSSVEIDYYTKIIAGETGINQEVLRREVIRSKQKPAGNQLERIQLSKEIQSPNKIPKAYQKAQELAVRYCLQSPDVIGNFPVAFLNDEFLKELIGFISKKMEASGKIEINQLMGHFDGSAEIQKIVEFMMNEEAVSRSDYQDALDIMNRFYHETLLEKISRQIKIQSTNGNDEAVAKLTTELIEIKKTMKEKREALK